MSWYRERKSRKDLIRHRIQLAKDAFVQAYSKEALSFSNIFYEHKDVVIVQICRNTGKQPPDRTWWRVVDETSCVEMTEDQVREHAVVEAWR